MNSKQLQALKAGQEVTVIKTLTMDTPDPGDAGIYQAMVDQAGKVLTVKECDGEPEISKGNKGFCIRLSDRWFYSENHIRYTRKSDKE